MDSKQIKIIAFCQLRNELQKGNLENWFKQLEFCDYIYVYDQNSIDGSLEYYKTIPNAVVIESSVNRFSEELICKGELLNKLLTEHPDVDWILWVDGDTLLDGRLLRDNAKQFKELCQYGNDNSIDCFMFEHYNLWRSDIYYRVDSQYHDLSGNVRALWRNTGNLSFNASAGLHGQQYPNGLKKFSKIEYGLIHRGFATDYQIITKYDVYNDRGQLGLERLLSETNLNVVQLPDGLLPDWFVLTDIEHPANKRKIKEIYDEQKLRDNSTNI
jgi:hypothetical protein